MQPHSNSPRSRGESNPNSVPSPSSGRGRSRSASGGVGFILLLSLTTIISCKTPDEPITPPTQTDSLVLKVTETQLKKAVLSLHTSGISYPSTLSLTRNSETVTTFSLFGKDTVLTDKNLIPSTSYNWQVLHERPNQNTVKSNIATGKTEDSTSHDFTWETHYFGKLPEGADLRDIALVNDSLAYVVGKIYDDRIPDTTTAWYKGQYNVARWNGKIWTYMKVFNHYGGQINFGRMDWVYAFGPDTVWFSNGVRWNGKNVLEDFREFDLLTQGVLSVWGSSPSNFYTGGYNGEILHFNGTNWKKLNSGTTLHIYDIYGAGNEVYAAANTGQSLETKILKLEGDNVTPISTIGIPYRVESFWFIPNELYMAAGEGVFEKEKLSDQTWNQIPQNLLTKWTTYGIRGSANNNIFIASGSGGLSHYNGSTWKNYGPLGFVIGDVRVRTDVMMTLGFQGNTGIVVIGKRTE